MEIKNYYFTYSSSETQPYNNGWTKIEAPTREIAIAIFRAIHPDKKQGIINCSWIYDEKQFKETSMWSKGNYGAHEVEVVLMQHININPF